MQNVIDSAKLNALIEEDIVREFERIYDSLRREEADKEIKLFARRKRATQRRTERMMNNQWKITIYFILYRTYCRHWYYLNLSAQLTFSYSVILIEN